MRDDRNQRDTKQKRSRTTSITMHGLQAFFKMLAQKETHISMSLEKLQQILINLTHTWLGQPKINDEQKLRDSFRSHLCFLYIREQQIETICISEENFS